MRRAARCGQPMRRNERSVPVLEDPVCGRRAGHPGQHLSEAVMRRRRYARRTPSGSPAIGMAIREARRREGMSQRRLAAIVGVTQPCVGLWERAQATPGPENWVQLQLALGPLGIVRERTLDPETAAGENRHAAA